MNNTVIAITIGPIYNTMQMVTKPAGLWAASYLFSYISKLLTDRIIEKKGTIITPFFKFEKDSQGLLEKGVGFYHDHILARGIDLESVSKMIEDVKSDIGQNVFNDLLCCKKVEDKGEKSRVIEYVKEYLQIYALEVEDNDSKNAILSSSKQLDSVELLGTSIPLEEKNYLAMFLEDNELLKHSFLVSELKKWMLLKKNENGESIRDIPDIARSDATDKTDFKRYEYFALVNSDGDRMGKIIGSLKDDDEIRGFSQKCLDYTKKACERILGFGGIVVFAGGDDLQFMVPLTHKIEKDDNGEKRIEENLFDLINGIVQDFNDTFKNEIISLEEKPSISFGVLVAYKKYPLYEMVSESHGLLQKAKDSGRNRCVFRLKKHSGQSAEIVINQLRDHFDSLNCAISPIAEVLMKDNKIKKDDGDENSPLMSVISHLHYNRPVFEIVLNDIEVSSQNDVLDTLIENTFDNIDQKKRSEYLEIIKELMKLNSYYSSFDEDNGKVMKKHKYVTDDVIAFLRILQFFGEKGREENE